MTSSIAWLDNDDETRQRMREALEDLRKGAVDELRLGRIRDAISDRLFPGTSVLWTRARYLLFVPWMFQALEREAPRQGATANPEDRLGELRLRLARGLIRWAQDKDDSVSRGIIGRRGGDVVQTPEINTWNSLKVWGILTQDVTRKHALKASASARPEILFESNPDSPVPSIWSPRMPAVPPEFPKHISLALDFHEAEFLASQLESTDLANDPYAQARQNSLLPVLLNASQAEFEGASTPLSQPFGNLSDDLHEVLEMAWCFAKSMRAAQLLYVQSVCGVRDDDQADAVMGDLQSEWAQWRDEVDYKRISRWHKSRERFRSEFFRGDRKSVSDDFRFVDEWTTLLLNERDDIAASEAGTGLIANREVSVKGFSRAKLSPGGLDKGVNIPAELAFRWDVAHSVISDLRDGLPS